VATGGEAGGGRVRSAAAGGEHRGGAEREGGVRVSASSGTLAGTLYPGVHFVAPLVEHVELFDLRDAVYHGRGGGWGDAGRS